MKFKAAIKLFTMISFLLSQNVNILPAQISAINALASLAGFSNEDLKTYLLNEFGVGLEKLTQNQGADVIRSFQSGAVLNQQLKSKKNQLLLLRWE